MKNIATYQFRMTFFFFTISLLSATAQDKGLDRNGNKITAYYIDLSSTIQNAIPFVLDVNDSSLDFQYHDYIGRSKTLTLTLFNWKNEVVNSYQIQKEFGLNFFHIPLKGSSLNMDEVYTVELIDEQSHHHTALIKWKKPQIVELVSDVVVNPKYLECGGNAGNVVEFYANLSGGKAPYTISWYVMDDHRTKLLYQPRTETIKRQGKTSSITVDQAPDYYILVKTVDACGNESKQTVHLTCEKGKKKINSLFVYPLDNAGQVKTAN